MKSGDKSWPSCAIFWDAKRKMSMAVNIAMVYSYYEAGRMIIDEEQNGSEREMTLPKDNNQIFASKYQTVLPSKEELQQLMNEKE